MKKALMASTLMTVVLLLMACDSSAEVSQASAGERIDEAENADTLLPTKGQSEFVGDMGEQRQWLTSVVLDDGRVLVAGGNSPTWAAGSVATAEVWTFGPDTWADTGEMSDARFSNGLVKLNDGRVMAIGGRGIKNHALNTAEIWAPQTDEWTMVNPMNHAHEKMPVVVLEDGRVVVIGGANHEYEHLSTTEVFDPNSGDWTEVAQMAEKRIWHTGILLSDGRVLVAGGGKPDGPWIKTAEIFDPSANKWLSAGEMTVSRSQHTATLLKDGRVLVVGGRGKRTTSEIYDPTTNSWGSVSDTSTPRAEHVAILLPDGRVLVAGGTGSRAPVEVYDPETNSWTTVGELLVGRYRLTAGLLEDGGILIVGGQGLDGVLAKTELFTLGFGAEVESVVRTGTAAEQEPTPEALTVASPAPEATPTPKPVDLASEFAEAVDSDPSGDTTMVDLGTPVRLSPGQEMTSPKGVAAGMTVKFVDVIEDTRCPSAETCDQPGRVVVKISLRSDSPLGDSEMTIEDGQEGTTIKRFGKYSVAFIDLEPRPNPDGSLSGEQIKASLVILLSKR